MNEARQEGGRVIDDKGVKWYGNGIYSKPRTDRDGKPCEAFFARVWIPSERKMRTWKAGSSLKQAQRKLRNLQGDPDKAAAERKTVREAQAIERARRAAAVTVETLSKDFAESYVSQGGTDFHEMILQAPVAFLGSIPVAALTPADVDRYLKSRRAERKSDGSPRVSEGSLRKEIIYLKMMLTWGKKQRGLACNSAVLEKDLPAKADPRPARPLTPDEERKLLALLPPLARDVVVFALYSMMRRGEVLKLEWRNIDRPAEKIHVPRGKTAARIVPLSLSPKLAEVLDRQPRRIGSDLVFAGTAGKPADVDWLNRTLEGAMAAAEIPKTRGVLWNSLRKTASSRFYANGGLPQDEADIAGHSIDIAMKHYRAFSPVCLQRVTGATEAPTGARTVTSNGSATEGPVQNVKQVG